VDFDKHRRGAGFIVSGALTTDCGVRGSDLDAHKQHHPTRCGKSNRGLATLFRRTQMSLIERAITLEWLDIKPADADVIRNVGTAATSDVVRSLMFSIHVLGVPEVMVIGHTGCGMEMFSEEEFENHLHTQCGVWAVAPDKFHFYSDVNRATEKQVLKLRSHPWIPSKVVIRGFVFDLATGELREVTPKDAR
jgi:carbonic anhydrase